MAGDAVTVLRERRGLVELEWEIPGFLDLPQKPGEHLESPAFYLGDSSWMLCIFPNGIKTGSSGWIYLYLRRTSDSGDHTVSCSFVLEAGGSRMREFESKVTFNAKNKSLGAPKLVQRSDLSDLVKRASWNGAVTVLFSGRLLSGRLQDAASQTSLQDGIENLSVNLKDLLLGGRRTDVKLKVQGREFRAHTSVLGARSPVFDAMFDVEMAEKNSRVVEIPDLEPESFEDFLLFMYTGKYDLLTPKNALDLYRAADKYSVNGIKTECSLRLASWLAVDNILDVLLLAETHGEADLLNSATDYFVKNAKDIFATERWKVFMVQKTSLANELLIKMAHKV